MFDTLRGVFESHGFVPIQTPSFENLSTLTGKYGEEGDQLVFKILNNGDFLAKANGDALDARDSKALTSSISKKALRYDLTVPFARFVVMNRNELTFPFKRYQVQNVWRGDRPGKGRYQEFTQCDCDIIGSESMLCELELVQIFSEGLGRLGVPGFRIMMNDRRVLKALATASEVTEGQFTDWTTAVDKLDKIGMDGVVREFQERGLAPAAGDVLATLVAKRSETNVTTGLASIEDMISTDKEGVDALNALRTLVQQAQESGVPADQLRFDPLLARGLDYYTGAIFEVVVEDSPVGSICGGGRYDDLTGIFGWSGLSGVGVSFGADRIEDVLNHFDAWPILATDGLDVMVVQMEGGSLSQELTVVNAMRSEGLSTELYPDAAKLKKQFKYANDRGVRWVVVLGQEELETETISLKDMHEGVQHQVSLEEGAELVKAK